MRYLTMTNDLNAAINHMIAVGNDYVVSDEIPAGLCIVNERGRAVLMDTRGQCDMNKFTVLEVL